jgi:hypothetical protein
VINSKAGSACFSQSQSSVHMRWVNQFLFSDVATYVTSTLGSMISRVNMGIAHFDIVISVISSLLVIQLGHGYLQLGEMGRSKILSHKELSDFIYLPIYFMSTQLLYPVPSVSVTDFKEDSCFPSFLVAVLAPAPEFWNSPNLRCFVSAVSFHFDQPASLITADSLVC